MGVFLLSRNHLKLRTQASHTPYFKERSRLEARHPLCGCDQIPHHHYLQYKLKFGEKGQEVLELFLLADG